MTDTNVGRHGGVQGKDAARKMTTNWSIKHEIFKIYIHSIFKLHQRLGKGAQGSVFLAENKQDKKMYVLKKVSSSLIALQFSVDQDSCANYHFLLLFVNIENLVLSAVNTRCVSREIAIEKALLSFSVIKL